MRKTQREEKILGTNRILFSSHLFTSIKTAWQEAPAGESIHAQRPEAFSSGLGERTWESHITALILDFPLYRLGSLFQAAFLKEADQ